MEPITGAEPEPAERVRSALRRCGHATIDLADGTTRRVLLAEVDEEARTLLLGLEGSTAAGSRGLRGHLSLRDEVVGPGPAAGTVRLCVEASGAVMIPDVPTQRSIAHRIAAHLPDPALLGVGSGIELAAFRPTSLTLLDRSGAASIDGDDLMTSGPDPFCDIEGLWLDHLNHPGCPVLPGLVRRMGPRALPGPPVLTAIDRFGLVVTANDPNGLVREVRLPFAEACDTVADLGRQIRLLMGCPRTARPLRSHSEEYRGWWYREPAGE